MTYPVFDTSGLAEAPVSHAGPVTCSACGCRLQRSADGGVGWFHFAPMAGRDARGCRVHRLRVHETEHSDSGSIPNRNRAAALGVPPTIGRRPMIGGPREDPT